MHFDPDRHHRRSIRLRDYDYSAVGAYFVTMCEIDRECLLGDIRDGKMRLSMFGETLVKCWEELPQYYPPVELDEYVIMPNHIHGILVINEHTDVATCRGAVSAPNISVREQGGVPPPLRDQ